MNPIDAVLAVRALTYMARDVHANVQIERDFVDPRVFRVRVRWWTTRGVFSGLGMTLGRAAHAAIGASGLAPGFDRETAAEPDRAGADPVDLFNPPGIV